MLHALAAIGWHLAFSTDLSKKGWDKDTLMFKPGPPVQKYFFAISFNLLQDPSDRRSKPSCDRSLYRRCQREFPVATRALRL